MPRIEDRAAIRAVLETDREWAAYALGDLAPEQFPYCEWRGTEEGALLLLYRRFGTPVLFTLGPAEGVQRLLEEIGEEQALFLSIRPEILPLVKACYTVRDETPMWRMILEPARARLGPDPEVIRLGPEDAPSLRALYANGEEEAPDYFFPEMLESGVFYGLREQGALVATAGTHLVAPSEGVAGVGNVYTRRDRRGRGLARRATAAVAAELLRQGLRTIALNVAARNAAAIRAYEHVGFVPYCPFYEGLAERAG